MLVSMKLQDYLSNTGQSILAFSKKSGVIHSTLWRMINEGREPNFKTMQKIIDASGGKITIAAYFD